MIVSSSVSPQTHHQHLSTITHIIKIMAMASNYSSNLLNLLNGVEQPWKTLNDLKAGTKYTITGKYL